MVTFKLVAIALIFVAGLCGGVFASRLESLPGRESVTRHANTFAGGVFLGAGLLHMLADAQSAFHVFMPNVDFPIVALLAGLGFLAILLLDKVLFTHGHHSAEQYEGDAWLYPYMLMIALSIHSIITGAALGLEDKTVVASAILIAVLAHKSTAAMALTVSFGRAAIPAGRRRNLLLMFYCTTPIGVALGTGFGVALEDSTEMVAEAIFDALASGTFLYISVVNILTEEFATSVNRLSLFVTTAIGFTGMAILAIWS